MPCRIPTPSERRAQIRANVGALGSSFPVTSGEVLGGETKVQALLDLQARQACPRSGENAESKKLSVESDRVESG